jgi:hypothetical protein
MTDAKKSGRKSSRPQEEVKPEPDIKPRRAPPPIRKKNIETPEEFDRLVADYISLCWNATPYPEPVTLTGMVLALGLRSKDSFYTYATYSPGFKDAVDRARLYVECAYETRLHSANPSGAIFALKNFSWMDITPEELEKIRLEERAWHWRPGRTAARNRIDRRKRCQQP